MSVVSPRSNDSALADDLAYRSLTCSALDPERMKALLSATARPFPKMLDDEQFAASKTTLPEARKADPNNDPDGNR